MKEINIFVELLKSLNVKYTFDYAMKLYREHPHKNNLYGLSAMLTSYGIENVGVKLEEKKQITNIEAPFIAFASNDFVLIKKIKDNKINYLWRDKKISISLDKFMTVWSGVLLIPEADKNSIEPNYQENRKKEFFDNLLSGLLWCILIMGGLYLLLTSELWKSSKGIILSLLTIGLYINYLLLQKQMNMQSNYADKLCSLFKKSDCNNVLESNAAKVGGIFSWSEIGFGYFVSTLILCLLFPHWIFYCAWISILTLPYTLWSVWYQWFKVKQWCPMCLIIMGLFWLLFIVYLFSGYLQIVFFRPLDLLWVGLLYILPFLIIHKFIPILVDARNKQQLLYELNSVKLNEKVFNTLLTANNHYNTSLSTSKIIFGNPESKTLITILTNPHCEPCAKMHTRVVNLLGKTGNKFCIQYVFSSFEKSLDISSKMLIAAYLENESEKVIEIYKNWFENGKYHKEDFFKEHNVIINDFVNKEFDNHENWIHNNKLRATPTILVNGYELPVQFKVEDLEQMEF